MKNNRPADIVDNSKNFGASPSLADSCKIATISGYYKTMYYRMLLNRPQSDNLNLGENEPSYQRENFALIQPVGPTVGPIPQRAIDAEAANASNNPSSTKISTPKNNRTLRMSPGGSSKKIRRNFTGSLDELHRSPATTVDTSSSSVSHLALNLQKLLSIGELPSGHFPIGAASLDNATLRYLLRKQRKTYKKLLENERAKREALEDFIVKINSPRSNKSPSLSKRTRSRPKNSQDRQSHRTFSNEMVNTSDEHYADNSSVKTSSTNSFGLRAIPSEKSSSDSMDRPKRRQWDRKRSSSLSTPENKTRTPEDFHTPLTPSTSFNQSHGSIGRHDAVHHRVFDSRSVLKEHNGNDASQQKRQARRKLFDKRDPRPNRPFGELSKKMETCEITDQRDVGPKNMTGKIATLNGVSPAPKTLIDIEQPSPQLGDPKNFTTNGISAFNGECVKILIPLNSQNRRPIPTDKMRGSRDSSLTSTRSSHSSLSTQYTELRGKNFVSPENGFFNASANGHGVVGQLPRIVRQKTELNKKPLSYFVPLHENSTVCSREAEKERKKNGFLQRSDERRQKINEASNLRRILAQKSRDLAVQVLVGQISLKEAGAALNSMPDPPNAFPKREIFYAAKKKFQMLPEVQQRRQKLLQEFELGTNRIRAKMFVQKQLRRTLSSKPQSR